VYVRKADGSPAVRLGPGVGADLSPDGRTAVGAVQSAAKKNLVLYPIGVGEPKALPPNDLRIEVLQWLSDGRSFVFSAAEPDRGSRLWVQGIDDPQPKPFSPEGYRMQAVSPDGKLVAVEGPDRRIYLYPIAGGEPTPIPGLVAGDTVSGFRRDGRSIFVRRRGEVPLRVMTLDLATGRKELWKEIMPADPAGVSTIAPLFVTPDEKSYVYSYTRTLGDLFVVDGVN
jgi:WD40 repeat protein